MHRRSLVLDWGSSRRIRAKIIGAGIVGAIGRARRAARACLR
jgi:hypothetical protein